MELRELRSMYAGETAWVIGSGATLNHLDPAFFNRKLVVSTNLGPVQFGITRPTFIFTNYYSCAQPALDTGSTVVTWACDWETKLPWQGDRPHRLVLAPHHSYDPPGDSWDPNGQHRPQADSLAFGSSSLHGAMHLAAWVGAAHIVIVGADCGTLDGDANFHGYPRIGDGTASERDRLLSLYERDHRRMKRYLSDTYGVTVYSLNPFINLNLEGHTFVGPDGRY
jgi:hypothetical protein